MNTAGSDRFASLPCRDHWPIDLTLDVMDEYRCTGETAFVGRAEPWSRAFRTDGTVWLEWRDARFEVSSTSVLVDAENPVEAVDLYWNTLIATGREIQGTPTMHGFVASGPDGRGLAVVGHSGAGKTTTGASLLDAGCDLVCDDLIILHPDGLPAGRPFVRHVRPPSSDAPVDVGGKERRAATLHNEPTMLGRILVLTDHAEPTPSVVSGMKALDLLLQHPYLPFEAQAGGGAQRLSVIAALLQTVEVIAAKPRSLPAGEFAKLLLSSSDATT